MSQNLCGPGGDDAELIRAYRAGDRAALAILFERYHPALVRILESRCGDSGRAEDAAMDTWTKVQARPANFDESRSFFNWLVGIGTKRLISNWRHDRRQQPGGAAGNELLELALQKMAQAPFDGSEVTETLARLTPEDRQLLVWKYLENRSLKEIGERLSIATGTVGSRLSRARERFQATFLRLGDQAR
jgi:RNA polymerase sigma-70 factor (ECF subfamily)